MIQLRALIRSLAPQKVGPAFDKFTRRWTKIGGCFVAMIIVAMLLAASIRILYDRHVYGELFEWIGPPFFAMIVWRLAGLLWLYWTLTLAPWSWESIRLRWPLTSVRNSKP